MVSEVVSSRERKKRDDGERMIVYSGYRAINQLGNDKIILKKV